MTRRWYHEVAPEWLKARQSVITATEIRDLRPEFKRAEKKPEAISPGFAALWAEKNSDMELDVGSVNAAARGHIMEPYAIEEWNRQRETAGGTLYHWDDCIIVRDGVGFSPDAMDFEQPAAAFPKAEATVSGAIADEDGNQLGFPKIIAEVKSYDPKKQMKCFLTPPHELDELMQLAVAFIVLPKLEKARLIFYCPSCKKVPMFERAYERDRLEPQIELAEKIIEKWKETKRRCEDELIVPLRVTHTEEEIYGEWMRQQESEESNIWLLKG